MRQRSITIGPLGRAPARAGKDVPPTPRAPEPPPPSAPEPGRLRRWLRGMFFENLALKFLSLVLALTVFLMVNTERDREITERVALSPAWPGGDKVLVSPRIDEVRVTIKGTPRRLREVGKLDPINLDLRDAPTGAIPITADMIKLPAGLEVIDINPRSVLVAWDERAEKPVEIAPLATGHPKHGFVMSGIEAVPATVTVRGAKGTLATLHSVSTRPVSVEGHDASFVENAAVVSPDGITLVGSPEVSAKISIDEQLVTRKVTLAVQVRGDGEPPRWRVDPERVDVTLTGALLAVEQANVVPVVKVTPSDPKSREATVSVEGLPPGIGVRLSPERVTIVPARNVLPTPP
jgi:YbbR domain-containing protein